MIFKTAMPSLAYLLIALLYWLSGFLNYSQAGKYALLGVLAVSTVSGLNLLYSGKKGQGVGNAASLAVVLPFLVLIALVAFLRDLYGVAQDDIVVIEALFSTNSGEAGEFMLQNAIGIVKHVGLMLFCASFYWWSLRFSHRLGGDSYRVGRGPKRRQAVWITSVCGVLFLAAHLNPTLRKENPLLYFPIRYAKWSQGIEATRMLQAKVAHAAADPDLASLRYVGDGPRTLVFAIGESTTRLNLSLYGYPRKTTPMLEELGASLLTFTDVVAAAGATVQAFQKMLTPATMAKPDLWSVKPDLLTIAKKAGYKTFWISNQGSASGATGVLSIFASHADRQVFTNRGGSRGEGSVDEVLFGPLREALADPAPKKFIILHSLGAHPAYNFRYPKSFARFDEQEDGVTKQLKEAGRAFWAIKLRNYYDNAMLYVDYTLRKTIDISREVSKAPVAVLFVSDHGQDAAHYSNFAGHNARVKSQFEVPMLFWRSPDFKLEQGEVAGVTRRPYQLDHVDHTVLGLLEIEGNCYDPGNDVFSPSFKQQPRLVADKPYP